MGTRMHRRGAHAHTAHTTHTQQRKDVMLGCYCEFDILLLYFCSISHFYFELRVPESEDFLNKS